ncbi:MAG: HAMP domain-containing sensor histidine kinase [Pseudomonadota bacterium]
MRRRSVFSSSVFRRTFGSSALLLLLLLALCWAAFWFTHNASVSRERELISFEAEAAEARFRRGGIEKLADDLAFENERIWDEDWLYYMLEEEEFVFRLVEGEDETLAGYPGLEADWEWGDVFLEHEELDDHPIIAYRLWLSDEYSLIVARFLPGELRDWVEILTFGSVILVLFILPLSLITGYLLSRNVFRRLSAIADTAVAVGEGTLDERVERPGNGDEFDRLAEAFNDMLDRVAMLTRNMRSVSVGVAHDLKTPVSNIDGRLQLIERDIDNPEAIREHLERSRSHIAALQRTLDALLRLGELEAGARKAAFTLVDLSTLVQDLVDSFEPVLAELDKALEANLVPGVFVFGDPDLLSQLIINLLDNIAEHARDGARAWVQLQGSGSEVLIVVGDDGPGIPDALHDQLFERFVKLDSSRGSSGNGLGLSLVKAIAELHGGNVQLQGGTRGAVFEVRLPSTQNGAA